MLNNLNTENLNYLIGFLQGDGHHAEDTRNRGRITISLSTKDEELLHKIKEYLSPFLKLTISQQNRKTNFKESFSLSNLKIYDWEFRTAIKPYVPVGKKSDIIEPPLSLPNFSKKHYIRGLIDADGSIGISKGNRPFISLCASSEKIKDFLIQDIEEITGIKKYLNRNARDNVYNIMLNNEEAITYANYLYSDSTLYLQRKYDEYLKFSSWQRTNNKRKVQNKKWFPEHDEIVMNTALSLQEKIELLGRTENSIGMRMWRLNNKQILVNL